jgi:hypothetical protein
MRESEAQARYRVDAASLAAIGRHLAGTDVPSVTVRLPGALASLATAAWDRDESGPDEPETVEQAELRRQAGALALIGLSVSKTGRPDGEFVVVELDAGLLGDALNAADN